MSKLSKLQVQQESKEELSDLAFATINSHFPRRNHYVYEWKVACLFCENNCLLIYRLYDFDPHTECRNNLIKSTNTWSDDAILNL